jgi:hypothetical protein
MKTSRFFSVSDNSLDKRGFPWIQSLGRGFKEVYFCRDCIPEERTLMYADGPVEAFLDRRKGTKWPDVLGCGHFSFFILSERALRAFSAEGVGEFPHHEVLVQKPFPLKLAASPAPRYFWIDGQKMRGASLDSEASGFVEVRTCPECGSSSYDIGATYDRQHSRVWPYVFRPGTWSGANLFTIDLWECMFFCTEAVVDCARKHRLTNFRFIPIEEGANCSSKGLEYM